MALVFGAGAARARRRGALGGAAAARAGGCSPSSARRSRGTLPVASPTDPFTVIVGLEDDEAARGRAGRGARARCWASPTRGSRTTRPPRCGRRSPTSRTATARGSRFTSAANTPAALAPLLERPEAAAATLFHAAAGRLHVFPGRTRRARPGRAARRARASRCIEAVAGDGDPAGVAALEPVVAPQAAVLALRARIRAALDPAGVLAFGPRWERGATREPVAPPYRLPEPGDGVHSRPRPERH